MLYLDLETRSPLNLKATGSYRYAEDCRLLLAAYAIDDGPARCWDAWHQPEPPDDLRAALAEQETIAHNAMFDRPALRATRPDLCPPIDRWRCAMAQAYAHGLPGALTDLGKVLGIPEELRKLDADGERLKKLFCGGKADPSEYPREWQRFIAYATRDVEALRAVVKRLPDVNYKGEELALWRADQRINDRGLPLDLALVKAAIKLCDTAKDRIDARAAELTEGRVTRVTQRARIVKEVDAVDCLTKAAVRDALDTVTDPVQRELLQLRQEGARSSVAKYRRMQRVVCADGRLRGTMQFAGAQRTGRWAGRGVQPQNLPRPSRSADAVEQGITALLGGYADLVEPDPLGLGVDSLRGVLCAPPGSAFVVGDWSSIESRMLAWLAGEKAKLRAFALMDAGRGPDIYTSLYMSVFGCAREDARRQVGKVLELGFQYGGGFGSLVSHAANYGIDLETLVEPAMRVATAKQIASAEWLYNKTPPDAGKEVFVACDVLKQIWRARHPAITAFWHALENAVVLAGPDNIVRVGPCRLSLRGRNLMVRLPSGRYLVYPNLRFEHGDPTFNKAPSWKREALWYGLLVENITQGAARDLLRPVLLNADAAGLPVILHSHDEVVAEVENGSAADLDKLCRIMETQPAWCPDLPLKVSGYVAQRYRKD